MTILTDLEFFFFDHVVFASELETVPNGQQIRAFSTGIDGKIEGPGSGEGTSGVPWPQSRRNRAVQAAVREPEPADRVPGADGLFP